MKKILHFIKQPVFIAVMGLLLLSLLIWFAGPHIKFGEGNTAPLASAIIRLVCIIILLLLWGLNNLRSQLWANKQTTDLVEGLQDDQQTHSATSDQEAEELHQINQRFADALATLKKIKFTSKGRKKGLYELPWYIIIGPPGAGKTTALINSSLDFPLAEKFGKVALQGVGGTRNCDWWFTNEAVLVDTAGRYTTQSSHRVVDSSAWEGFLNLLKRHRRRRPINGVVVAVSVLDLLTQTEEERLQNAKLIRQRLDELMDKLQVRFPVYLILTKSDLMAGFTEFFEDLGRDEREQVWGISLPNAPQASQSPDFDYLSQEYDKLSTHIHERVLWRLHQERDPQRRGAIHGFPLQFESLRKIVEGFVQQTFIKNRYQFQPYLRGLYFTSGLQDGNPIDRLMTSLAANFGFSRETTATSTQQGKSFFLGDLFRYVIFPESELVGSNVRYERFIRWSQRAAYVALLVITVGVMAVWTGSVTRHKMFMSEVDSYVDEFIAENKRVQSWNQDIRTLLPGLGALAKASIVYDQQSHPWLNGIGMYDPRVDDQANQAYETKLTTLFLPKLIDTLEVFIKQGHGGGDLYNTFRTYMMFNKVEFMNRDLITDWFSRYWDKQYHGSGEVRQQLKKHLADLLSLNLAPNELDPRLVVDTRNLLLRVPVAQRIYSRLRTNPDYSQKIDMRNYIGESVRTSYDLSANRLAYLQVPYLFTIEGYKAIDLSKGSPMIASIVNEDWVLSDDNSERVDFLEDDLDEISRQVEALYLSEYSRIWVNLYQGLAVTEFKNLSHASNVLASFTDPVYSPLVSILQVGKTNTQLSVPLAQNLADDNAEGNLGKATRYLADTFEGNTVDKRFRELNVLLRESSQRPAPIAGIIQQIQQLQSFVNEITIAPDPSQQSFDIVKARYSSGSGNAITALKGYAKNTPEPVKTWLNTLADES
ncbi:MAG: type VI secretion system membrane subunit TssM, partial [Pseudomonadota bacterium]